MSFELEGKIEVIFEEQQVTERFKKRDFVVAMQNGAYTEQIKLQFTQDRCMLLDEFSVGDRVKVMFNLRGRAYEKEGRTTYFTNLDAWRISAVSTETSPQGTSSAPELSAQDAPPPEDNLSDDQLPF